MCFTSDFFSMASIFRQPINLKIVNLKTSEYLRMYQGKLIPLFLICVEPQSYNYTESTTRVVLLKKLFRKISQYPQENTCVGVSFLIKLQTQAWRRTFANGCFCIYRSSCSQVLLQNSCSQENTYNGATFCEENVIAAVSVDYA